MSRFQRVFDFGNQHHGGRIHDVKPSPAQSPAAAVARTPAASSAAPPAKQSPLPAMPQPVPATWWTKLLWFAWALGDRLPPGLLELLGELYAQGALIEVVHRSARETRLKLLPGRLAPEEWERRRNEALAPHRDWVKRLLEWTALGAVPVRSKVLDSAVIYLTCRREWVAREKIGPKAAIYAEQELRLLKGLGPDELRAVHQAKMVFAGEVTHCA